MNHTNYSFLASSSLCLGLLFMCLPLQIHAEFYVYKENDGTSWITDRKMPQEKYTLMATIGRPTAVVSCRRMTPSKLAKRASSYADAIEAYSIAYEVDPKLVKAIIAIESCFDRKAVSSVGARGLMQLMPATAKELGVKDSFDANQNIRGGIKYFSQMLTRFNDNTELALAAYNAGPNAVEKYGGIPPYAETKGYVKKVLKRYANYVTKSSTAAY
ncbi:MAG: lytic transglycosylase domain-containing protein [Gammaproteobacteria bacterium]|nr:lytic transglycosylase domain-containing protein [Gammaproteobacteria bacterium]